MGELGKMRKNLHYPLWLILFCAVASMPGWTAGPAGAASPDGAGKLESYGWCKIIRRMDIR